METSISNRKLSKIQNKLLIVHYSCSSFSQIYPEISSISTYDTKNKSYKLFSRKNKSQNDEVKMLNDFLNYVKKKIREGYTLLGWYWGDKFGIIGLVNRYKQLNKTKFKLNKITYFDLIKILSKEFPRFFGGLRGIAEFNDLDMSNFIEGEKEINLLKTQDYNSLSKSSKSKVAIINKLLNRYLDKNIKVPTTEEAFYEIKTLGSYPAFQENMRYVRALIDTKNTQIANVDLQEYLRQLLYANIISAMEIYLSDTFIRVTIKNSNFLIKYLSAKEALKEKKSIREFYTELFEYAKSNNMDIYRYARTMCIKDMKDITFHNIDTAQNLFKEVLGVKLSVPKEIRKAVYRRHDIVHRNGKDKNDNKINVSLSELENLMKLTENFVNNTNKQIKKAAT